MEFTVELQHSNGDKGSENPSGLNQCSKQIQDSSPKNCVCVYPLSRGGEINPVGDHRDAREVM